MFLLVAHREPRGRIGLEPEFLIFVLEHQAAALREGVGGIGAVDVHDQALPAHRERKAQPLPLEISAAS